MNAEGTRTEVTIVSASREHLPQAVGVLADAFMTEGFITHLFDLSSQTRRERFRRVLTRFAASWHNKGQPILVALRDQEPVGIAILKRPGNQIDSFWVEISALLPHPPLLLSLFSKVRWRRLPAAFRAMQPPETLGKDYFTLEALAVAPAIQGQGIGRQLLDAVHETAEHDPDSDTIYLYTADEQNRDIYERIGYRTLASVNGGPDFTVHHMARPLASAASPTKEGQQQAPIQGYTSATSRTGESDMTASKSHSQVRIVPANAEHLPQAVRVLAEAFMTEGFTRHMFDLSTERKRERLWRAQIRFAMDKQAAGQPILLAVQGDEPVGIAILKMPVETKVHVPWHKRLGNTLPYIPTLLGLAGQIRWRRALALLGAVKTPEAVSEGYYTLEGLAVAPTHQGQGIGRRLLEAVHQFVEQDPAAQGVYLYTADERNRAIYERSGYRIIASNEGASTLTVYHMALCLADTAPETAETTAHNGASRSGLGIVPARDEHLSGAAHVLARAFENEVSTQWIVDLSTPKSRQRLEDAMASSMILYYALGHTNLVALKDGKVVGVAVLGKRSTQPRPSWWTLLRASVRHSPGLVGFVQHLRRRNLAEAGPAVRPPRQLGKDHHLLEWLAVDPDYQGLGIGRLLLDRIREIEESDPGSHGIYTYTVGDKNWTFYQKSGYRLVSRAAADDAFVVYHMVLPMGDPTA